MASIILNPMITHGDIDIGYIHDSFKIFNGEAMFIILSTDSSWRFLKGIISGDRFNVNFGCMDMTCSYLDYSFDDYITIKAKIESHK